MNKDSLAKAIFETSHLKGRFTLRSGQISKEYFDKYLFESNPQLLSEIAKHLATLIPEGTEILAGLDMGGIPIATALSLQTGLPVTFVRKEAKEYGTCKLAEGVSVKGRNVLVIEDVITTGGQVVLSVEELKKFGAIITNTICVIERDIKGKQNLSENGINLISLFTMGELKKYEL